MGFFESLWFLVYTVLKIMLIIVPLLLTVAYLTYAERKVIGAIQVRKGPNRVGFAGLLQPIADVLKLMTCLLYTSPSPRDATLSRMPSSA